MKPTIRALCAAAAAATAAALLAAPASAALLQPDGHDASSEFSGSYDGGNTYDGSGLPVDFTYADAHADYAVHNHWTTDGSAPTDEWIIWTFSSPVDLFNIVLWNHRSNIISDNPGYEPVLFDLTVMDGLSNVLLTLDDVALAPDTATGQVFALGALSGVASVRFDVEATQSSTNYTGLAEVAFNDETAPPPEVPLPAAALLLPVGLAGLFALRRKG